MDANANEKPLETGGAGRDKGERDGLINAPGTPLSTHVHGMELRLVLEFCDCGSLRDVLDQV